MVPICCSQEDLLPRKAQQESQSGKDVTKPVQAPHKGGSWPHRTTDLANTPSNIKRTLSEVTASQDSQDFTMTDAASTKDKVSNSLFPSESAPPAKSPPSETLCSRCSENQMAGTSMGS